MLVNGNAPLVRPDGKGLFLIDLRNQYLPGTPGARSGTQAGVEPPDPLNKIQMSELASQQR